ncbi:uncharacterized protein LOC108339794 isoform X1 [Vigna angularis]|uniref:uncharacterized protein LOC108339794 isoform X1 n=1 Tax=Phaseolus angularis TaxID=3914 RepID=UPI0022B511A8|nr:uncharacterized protein LOC108339794 isoform X1 [Vigna angularis]
MHTCVEGSKRQLPSWMMQKVGATAIHVSDSDNAVESNCSMKKVDDIAAYATENDPKSRPSRRKSNLRAKCDDGSFSKATQKKKKSAKPIDRDQRSSTKKRKKLEDPSHGCDDIYQVQASSDDAVDLTVEDLLVIAEQCVNEYENKDRKEISSRQSESKWEFQVTHETGTTLDSPCEKRNPFYTRKDVLSNSASQTGEVIDTSTSRIGDPAQDMLNLFLGPLLSKTLEKEKSKHIVENAKITHEFTRQSQDELRGEERVPLMKKRYTLKDKHVLASFLKGEYQRFWAAWIVI